MSGRQFNHIENKIKQAAENFQRAYHEPAWDRMEALLDEEKRKKRLVYWWWRIPLILLISVIILYPIILPSPVNKEIVRSQTPIHSAPEIKVAAYNSIIQKPKIISPSLNLKIKEDETKKNDLSISFITIEENKPILARFDIQNPVIIELEKESTQVRANTTEVNNPSLQKINSSHIEDNEESPFTETEPFVAENKKNNNLPEREAVTLQKEAKIKIKSSFLFKLYVTVTGGAEAPGLKRFSYSGSKISAKSGIGLGYQINHKFNLETGFYLGSKKYITGPENYKYPDGSYWNTVELTQVDANCFIYEIPLLLRYNFFQKKSLLLNVSGGMESFIMQKEDYVFDYLKNGAPHSSSRSYKGNSHFLSSIQFSIGMEKQLNQKISFLLTSSISIPINGVGNGKVKLHSTSIQAGIKYYPFQKK